MVRPSSPTRKNNPHPAKVFMSSHMKEITGYFDDNPDHLNTGNLLFYCKYLMVKIYRSTDFKHYDDNQLIYTRFIYDFRHFKANQRS